MIVAFTGFKGSGKSEAAQALYALGFQRHSFADPIKAAMRAFGLTADDLSPGRKEQPMELLCGKSPRWAMQALGTEYGRECIGKDFWTNVWLATLPIGPDIVVDDLRFLNEATLLREMGAPIIRVHRPATRMGFDSHPSETEQLQIEVDDTITNYGDASFAIMVREAVERCK